MDFAFTIAGITEQAVTVWTPAKICALPEKDQQLFPQVIDTFGRCSSLAQGLSGPVTTHVRFLFGGNPKAQHLYLAAQNVVTERMQVLGGLKSGHRRLFVHVPEKGHVEADLNCVLDFYVHADFQRLGVGRAIFQTYLAEEELDPGLLAYDRPSPKMLSFLEKVYGLTESKWQNNNFVVFDGLLAALQGMRLQQRCSNHALPMRD